MFTCSCGKKTLSLRYYGDKTSCDNCSQVNLSGVFERRLNSDRQQYAKDLIQPKDAENFKKVYGEEAYNKATKGH